ncbi:MAG: lipid II:glycine glycyltransferase FemX [bacterium]
MASIDSIEAISPDMLHAPVEFMQSPLWARAKKHRGMQPLAFRLTVNGGRVDLLAFDQQPGEPSGICYIPHGPALSAPPDDYAETMSEIADTMSGYLDGRVACIRFDLPWPSMYSDRAEHEARPAPHLQEIRMNFGRGARGQRIVRKAPTDILPVDTLIIDLLLPTESIFWGMKKKTRYNIRLAGRHGVHVERYWPGNRHMDRGLDVWTGLSAETEARNRLTATDSDHVISLFESAAEHTRDFGHSHERVELLIARQAPAEGSTPLAAAVIAYTREKALYLYGASSDRGRNRMGPYALQWEAIRAAKAAGCRWYDFFGVPPAEDPSHPLYGLSRFKRGFGGQTLHRAGCWDIPLEEEAYEILRARESAGPAFHRS